jgi:hypothetical protein
MTRPMAEWTLQQPPLLYIVTVNGRGYRFTAPVAFRERADLAEVPGICRGGSTQQIVGRGELIDRIVTQLDGLRFLTIVAYQPGADSCPD